MMKTVNSGLIEFIKAAMKDPKMVSTIFPSLRFLAQALLKHSTLTRDQHVLELGCGSGAITKHILKAGPHASYLGVELNGELVQFLQKSYPGFHFINESADDLKDFVKDESIDIVISTLPWTMFPEELQESIIKEIIRVLKPGGHFVTFLCIHALAYPSAPRAQKLFKQYFSGFDYCETISRNIPPANVYRGIK